MKLIPNWRRTWRAFSMQAMGWGAAALASWPLLPDDLKAVIDPKVAGWGIAGLLLAGMFGRIVDQPKTRTPTHQDTEPQQ